MWVIIKDVNKTHDFSNNSGHNVLAIYSVAIHVIQVKQDLISSITDFIYQLPHEFPHKL